MKSEKSPVLQIRNKRRKNVETEDAIPPKDDQFGLARYLEKKGMLKEAAKTYEKLIKQEPYRESNYNRLMMIYRKQKDYKNEIRIINTGIETFRNFYMPSAIGKHKSIIDLSKKLNVLIGLSDKKGNKLTDAEPIAKWKKRKATVLKRINQ